MKRSKGETLEHFRHRLFMTRTSDIYRHQKEEARKAGAKLDYNLDQLRGLVGLVLGRPCRYCGDTLTPRTFGIDHAHPVSRGGAHALANLAVICVPCNDRKGKMTAGEFQQLMDISRTWPPDGQLYLMRALRSGARALAMNWKMRMAIRRVSSQGIAPGVQSAPAGLSEFI